MQFKMGLLRARVLSIHDPEQIRLVSFDDSGSAVAPVRKYAQERRGSPPRRCGFESQPIPDPPLYERTDYLHTTQKGKQSCQDPQWTGITKTVVTSRSFDARR